MTPFDQSLGIPNPYCVLRNPLLLRSTDYALLNFNRHRHGFAAAQAQRGEAALQAAIF